MSDDPNTKPDLFIMRLWRVYGPEGETEWWGRLHHTNSNNTSNFRDLPALIPTLLAMLREKQEKTILTTEPELPNILSETGEMKAETP